MIGLKFKLEREDHSVLGYEKIEVLERFVSHKTIINIREVYHHSFICRTEMGILEIDSDDLLEEIQNGIYVEAL